MAGKKVFHVKMLKKIRTIFILCLLPFVLSGCDTLYSLYRLSDNPVVNIELIYYYSPNARANPSDEFVFDIDKLEVLAVLEPDKIDYFLDTFGIGVIGGRGRVILFSHDGIGFRITHEGGSFEVVTLTTINEEAHFFTGYYDEMGVAIQTIRTTSIRHFEERFEYLLGLFDYSLP
jgi:hypothetical protein